MLGKKEMVLNSHAQITDCYEPEDLIGRQVFVVVNFPTTDR